MSGHENVDVFLVRRVKVCPSMLEGDSRFKYVFSTLCATTLARSLLKNRFVIKPDKIKRSDKSN